MTANKLVKEKEYMMLREEIMYIQKRRESIIQHTYTVGIALFAAAFASKISWINLCILPYLISASLKATECGNSLGYLASYMEVFLEESIDIKWETNNHKYAKNYPKKGFRWLQHFIGRCDFLCLAIISCFLFWLMRDFSFEIYGRLLYGIVLLVIQAIVIVFEMYLSFYYSNYATHKNKTWNNWEWIKENDKPN